MKKIIGIAVAVTLLAACSKENSLENSAGGNTTTSTTCFECDYMPVCDSTSYTYVDSTNGTNTTSLNKFVLLADTTIRGLSYKKMLGIVNGSATAPVYYTCASGNLGVYAPSATSNGGSTVSAYFSTFVKASAPVGTTWTDTMHIVSPQPSDVYYTFVIAQKGITYTVLDSTYRDVIYIRDTLSMELPLVGSMPMAVTHRYYAKGIGPIEHRMENLLTGTYDFYRRLKKYRIR